MWESDYNKPCQGLNDLICVGIAHSAWVTVTIIAKQLQQMILVASFISFIFTLESFMQCIFSFSVLSHVSIFFGETEIIFSISPSKIESLKLVLDNR